MICPIDQHGYCARHQTRHVGGMARLALRNDPMGEKYRLLWDRQMQEGKAPWQFAEQSGDQVAAAAIAVEPTPAAQAKSSPPRPATAKKKRAADERSLECFHLGDVLDKRGSNCSTCWIRECDLYGTCTTGRKVNQLPMCSTCEDYTAEPPDPAIAQQPTQGAST